MNHIDDIDALLATADLTDQEKEKRRLAFELCKDSPVILAGLVKDLRSVRQKVSQSLGSEARPIAETADAALGTVPDAPVQVPLSIDAIMQNTPASAEKEQKMLGDLNLANLPRVVAETERFTEMYVIGGSERDGFSLLVRRSDKKWQVRNRIFLSPKGAKRNAGERTEDMLKSAYKSLPGKEVRIGSTATNDVFLQEKSDGTFALETRAKLPPIAPVLVDRNNKAFAKILDDDLKQAMSKKTDSELAAMLNGTARIQPTEELGISLSLPSAPEQNHSYEWYDAIRFEVLDRVSSLPDTELRSTLGVLQKMPHRLPYDQLRCMAIQQEMEKRKERQLPSRSQSSRDSVSPARNESQRHVPESLIAQGGRSSTGWRRWLGKVGIGSGKNSA